MGIDSELSSLSYSSIDHLASLVVSEGRGSFLVKADIKEAYRMVPVHPEDQHLIGVQWERSSIHRSGTPIWVAFSSQTIYSSG